MTSPANSLERRDQLGKRWRYFIERAREQPHLPAAAMRLGANAVVLVFDDLRVLEVLERFFGVGRGAGQHEADGMEQPHPRLVEPMLRRQLQRGADIAQQHVGALHARQRLVIGFGDRFLHQAFFQPDAQLAGDDLQDVLGFERGGALQQRFSALRTFAAAVRVSAIWSKVARTSCERDGCRMPALSPAIRRSRGAEIAALAISGASAPHRARR